MNRSERSEQLVYGGRYPDVHRDGLLRLAPLDLVGNVGIEPTAYSV